MTTVLQEDRLLRLAPKFSFIEIHWNIGFTGVPSILNRINKKPAFSTSSSCKKGGISNRASIKRRS